MPAGRLQKILPDAVFWILRSWVYIFLPLFKQGHPVHSYRIGKSLEDFAFGWNPPFDFEHRGALLGKFHPNLPLPISLGMKMGWFVIHGPKPTEESLDFKTFDLGHGSPAPWKVYPITGHFTIHMF